MGSSQYEGMIFSAGVEVDWVKRKSWLVKKRKTRRRRHNLSESPIHLQGMGSFPTNNIPVSSFLLAFVFLFAKVMTLSANRCVSFAFAYVVTMCSCIINAVTWLRSSAWRAAEVRLRCRYLTNPPAMIIEAYDRRMKGIAGAGRTCCGSRFVNFSGASTFFSSSHD